MTDELLLVAKCIWREARNQGVTGMSVVANVIHNRTLRRRQTYTQVVMAKWQFSSMTDPHDPQLHNEPTPDHAADWSAYQSALKLAASLGTPALLDITDGATMYYDASIPFPKTWNRAVLQFIAKIGAFYVYREL